MANPIQRILALAQIATQIRALQVQLNSPYLTPEQQAAYRQQLLSLQADQERILGGSSELAQAAAAGTAGTLGANIDDWQAQQEKLAQQEWELSERYADLAERAQYLDESDTRLDWTKEWHTFNQDRRDYEERKRQFEATMAYNYTGMGISQQESAADRALKLQIAQMEQQQAQQQMAAGIGQTVAGLQTQAWETGLPFALPQGTPYAPGFGPGGPMSTLLGMSGSAYLPESYKIAPFPAPTADQMMNWIQQAMGQFG